VAIEMPGAVRRLDPDRLSGERRALDEWVDFHRATLLKKCEGLTSDQLKLRSVEPSALSLLGLVRHMAGVERWWFRMHAAREDVGHLYGDEHHPDADFTDVDAADAAIDLATYVEECQRCRDAVMDLSLDDVVPSRGDHPDRTRNVRWIYLHMLEEYARHNGHADLLREGIDGVTGD
jgi:hypothetical protein